MPPRLTERVKQRESVGFRPNLNCRNLLKKALLRVMFPACLTHRLRRSQRAICFGRGARSALAVLVVLSFSACNDARAARSDEGSSASSGTALNPRPADGSSLASLQTPQPAGLRWAKKLDWVRRGDSIALTIAEPWKGARTPLRYSVRFDTLSKLPKASAGIQRIRVPARRIAALAAAHTGFLAALGQEARIVAVDAKRHVYNTTVRASLDAKRVVEVGSGSSLNVERLLATKPDLVLTNAVGASEYQALQRLQRAGIPVLVTAEWMEDHPLARAEWMRLIGVLVGAEARADSLFKVVEGSYLQAATLARGMKDKPTVLLGGPFRDQWFVSGGRSFMARVLEDAGADYLWRLDTTAGGVPLSFETVLTRARDAQLWLHPGDWRRLADGTRQDARFSQFGAFKRGDVYNSDARRHADGAVDYWESGVVRPDRVLADLVSIFHGTEDSLFYFRRLPP